MSKAAKTRTTKAKATLETARQGATGVVSQRDIAQAVSARLGKIFRTEELALDDATAAKLFVVVHALMADLGDFSGADFKAARFLGALQLGLIRTRNALIQNHGGELITLTINIGDRDPLEGGDEINCFNKIIKSGNNYFGVLEFPIFSHGMPLKSYKIDFDGLVNRTMGKLEAEVGFERLAKWFAWRSSAVAGAHNLGMDRADQEAPSAPAQAHHLDEAELAEIRRHAAEHPWLGDRKLSPSAFIEQTYAKWLGQGLARSHIQAVDPRLAQSYAKEISRDPSRRLEGLLSRPRTRYPDGEIAENADASRSATNLFTRWVPASELNDEQQAERRRLQAHRKRAQRAAKLMS